jgi:DNA-binding beta-propeller fold protein YncE
MPSHPEQLLVVDGANSEFAVLNARTGAVIASYLSKGRYAGQMHWPHQVAVDQQGAVYIAEVQSAARIQRFLPVVGAAQVRRKRP